MTKIIVTAENFAFGPVGKLLTITKQLQNKGYHITFIGEGTSFQLANKENFDRIIKFDTTKPNYPKEIKDVFAESDFLLSCMDFLSARYALSISKPVIFLDILFWWRNSLPKFIFNVDYYIKQDTLDDSKNVLRYSKKIKNLLSVGPIVDLSALDATKKENQVLVAYGGLEAKGMYEVGVNTNYPDLITDLIIKNVNLENFDRVVFTGNEIVLNDLSKKYSSKKYQFKTLSHYDFLKEINKSKLVLMTPGIETPIEVFSYGVPAIFLPPSSSSNYVQLDSFIENGVALMSTHFTDFYKHMNLLGKNHKKGRDLFIAQLNVFEKDKPAQKMVAEKLNKYIQDRVLQKKQILNQKKYIEGLGGNGTKETLKVINKFIKNNCIAPQASQ